MQRQAYVKEKAVFNDNSTKSRQQSPISDRVPSWMVPLIKLDRAVSGRFSCLASERTPYVKLRSCLKGLEVSCHGASWIAVIFVAFWYSVTSRQVAVLVNLFGAIIFDIIAVAFSKAAVRRRRPNNNAGDMFATVAVDQYSFPSGHASRAILLAFFFTELCNLHFLVDAFILFWALSVCVSRVILGRHFIGDVIGGIVLGILESIVVYWFWLSEETSVSLYNFFSDLDLRQSGD